AEVAATAGLEVMGTLDGALRWTFSDLDDAVDVLTQAAGGLRVLRARLEDTGRWPTAAAEIRADLAGRCVRIESGLALDDHYALHVLRRR
ncbi:MAG: hypothetical protein AAGG08_10835, partial [Actinomycetota bacterium]